MRRPLNLHVLSDQEEVTHLELIPGWDTLLVSTFS
jgi:hypothetical protein